MISSLKNKELLGYGIGDAGQALIGTLVSFYQMYFFTDVLKLSLTSVAGIFLLTKILDTICYPLFGILVDKACARYGGMRKVLVWLIVPFVVSSGMLWVFDSSWSQATKITYTYGATVVFVVMSSLISIVYSGLTSTIAVQATDRARLSTVRFTFAFGASTIASLMIKDVVQYFGGVNGGGFYWTAVIFSAAASIFLLTTYISSRERSKVERTEDAAVGLSLHKILMVRPFLAPLAATVCTGIFVAFKSQTAVYFIQYVLKREDISNYFLAGGTVACALGVACVGLIINRVDRKRLFMALMFANAFFVGSIYFVDSDQMPTILALHMANSFFGGACAPVLFSIFSDVIDHIQLTNNRHMPSLVIALSMLGGRLGGSVGSALCPLILSYFSYSPGQVQTQSGLNGIALLFTLVPAAFAMAAGCTMMFYAISNRQAQATSHKLFEIRMRNNVAR